VNSQPVLRAAEQAGRLDGLTVIATDIFPELVDWIRAGKVAATVYQRPLTQGRVALQALHQFLLHRTARPVKERVTPFLVMRSNLDLVLERLSVDRTDAADVEPAGREAHAPGRRAESRAAGGSPSRRRRA
jgi:LacI family transcriptional regulator